MEYTYYLTQRPAGPGCQPRKGLLNIEDLNCAYVPEIGMEAWSKVTYDRQLTPEEIRNYELTPIQKGGKTMQDYHITADSFGSECPSNWEEIADYLNAAIDLALEQDHDYFAPGYDDSGLSAEGHEIVNDIWERFCAGGFPDAPAPV